MRVTVTIERFERVGLIVIARRGRPFTIAYGEILTAERVRARRRMCLHTTMMGGVQLRCGRDREKIEHELRNRGVRIVDCWGAIITSSLEDFEHELLRSPRRVRQSYDNG